MFLNRSVSLLFHFTFAGGEQTHIWGENHCIEHAIFVNIQRQTNNSRDHDYDSVSKGRKVPQGFSQFEE